MVEADAVLEDDAADHVGQQFMAVEQAPVAGGALREFKHHRQGSDPAAAPFGATMPQANGGEGGLDRIGRPQVPPVLGREVVKRLQHVSVFRQTLRGLGILGLVGLHEGVKRLVRRLARVGHPDLMQHQSVWWAWQCFIVPFAGRSEKVVFDVFVAACARRASKAAINSHRFSPRCSGGIRASGC